LRYRLYRIAQRITIADFRFHSTQLVECSETPL
jgi:hypothetical protein